MFFIDIRETGRESDMDVREKHLVTSCMHPNLDGTATFLMLYCMMLQPLSHPARLSFLCNVAASS